MKIIAFTYSIPRPDKSSGERRFVKTLELLAEHNEVDLCVARFGKWLLTKQFEPYIQNLESLGVHVLPIHKNGVKEALAAKKYDVGFFEFYWIAEETISDFRKYQPHAITVIDSVDLHYAREETQAKIGLIKEAKAKETKERELKIYREADITVAVSIDDFKTLTEKEDVGKVLIIPNIIDIVARSAGERDPVVVFIGAYLWPPNVDAVKWFMKEVCPIVHKLNDRAEFLIIGSDPPDEIKAFNDEPGVKVLGFVPETDPYLEKAAVSVAPLRYGGGMKGKVNEALAHGVPVVATSIGAQGFRVENDEHMLIEDDAEGFANAIIALLEDPEKQRTVGLAGQKFNETICSPDVVRVMINDLMHAVSELLHHKHKEGSETSNSLMASGPLNNFWRSFKKLLRKPII